MLLMVEKGIRGGICQSIHRYTKANNKYMKDYNKNKESSYIHHWDVDNLYCWSMLLSLNNFEWFEDTFQFNGDFIKNYNEGSGSWWRILSWRWFSVSGKITWTS